MRHDPQTDHKDRPSRVLRATRRGVILSLAALPLAGFVDKLFSPSADLWERWTAHDPNSRKTIDHAAWDRFVGIQVQPGQDGVSRLPYGAIPAADRDALRVYVAQLAALPISRFSRKEQLAYWINLYNALTVQVVLDDYPVESIRDIDISPGLFADGPWDKELVEIEGEDVSLNDIEHRILRPIWKDPRIHYAVNCASIGCPNLLTKAFTGATVEAQMDQAARAYVNHPRGSRVTGGKLQVSSIYVWFQDDFGGNDAGVIDHLKRYAEPDLAAQLAGVNEIDKHDYDWTLNDSSVRQQSSRETKKTRRSGASSYGSGSRDGR